MLYQVVLSVDEILKCDYSNKRLRTVLSRGGVVYISTRWLNPVCGAFHESHQAVHSCCLCIISLAKQFCLVTFELIQI